jgi:hypothetical protein
MLVTGADACGMQQLGPIWDAMAVSSYSLQWSYVAQTQAKLSFMASPARRRSALAFRCAAKSAPTQLPFINDLNT